MEGGVGSENNNVEGSVCYAYDSKKCEKSYLFQLTVTEGKS